MEFISVNAETVILSSFLLTVITALIGNIFWTNAAVQDRREHIELRKEFDYLIEKYIDLQDDYNMVRNDRDALLKYRDVLKKEYRKIQVNYQNYKKSHA
jgi:hypothetical protein